MSKAPIYRLVRVLRPKLGDREDLGPIGVACIRLPDVFEEADEIELSLRRVRSDGAVVNQTLAIRLTADSRAEIYDFIATDHPRAKLADEVA